MPEQQHCVIAMDENGSFIQFMDLRILHRCLIPYRQRHVWTDDWGKAVAMCGKFNANHTNERLHPNERRNEVAVKVGGYEVVTELGGGVWI